MSWDDTDTEVVVHSCDLAYAPEWGSMTYCYACDYSPYHTMVQSIEVNLVRTHNKPSYRDRFLICTFDEWIYSRCWGTRPLSVAVSKLAVPRLQVTVPWVSTHSFPQKTLWLPNRDPGRQHFWKARSIGVFDRTPFFLVTHALDRLSLACAKAWGLQASDPAFPMMIEEQM